MTWGYANGFVIEYDTTKRSKKKSCSKCVYYVSDDKSCEKKPVYVPDVGYNYCKWCEFYTEALDDNDEDFDWDDNSLFQLPINEYSSELIAVINSNKGEYKLYSYSGIPSVELREEYERILIKAISKRGKKIQIPMFVRHDRKEMYAHINILSDHIESLKGQTIEI